MFKLSDHRHPEDDTWLVRFYSDNETYVGYNIITDYERVLDLAVRSECMCLDSPDGWVHVINLASGRTEVADKDIDGWRLSEEGESWE